MLAWIVNKYGNMKPVVIDGFLYVVIAMGGSIEVNLTSDDCYKYMNAYVIWYSKMFVAVFIAGVTALKMFRSTSYSEHQAEKKAASNLQNGTGNTTVITKTPTV